MAPESDHLNAPIATHGRIHGMNHRNSPVLFLVAVLVATVFESVIAWAGLSALAAAAIVFGSEGDPWALITVGTVGLLTGAGIGALAAAALTVRLAFVTTRGATIAVLLPLALGTALLVSQAIAH
jgi:hypothetical protein